MRIIFLGTSHGAPEPNRRCSSILIEIGEARYLIDMGTQSIEQLVTRGIRPESVKACFITHMHSDHADGLLSFLGLYSSRHKNANPAFYLPGDTERCAAAIKEWLACLGVEMRPFPFVHVDDGFVYQDESITLRAYRTKHIDQSFSYVLEAEGKRVYFSGDLGSPAIMENPIADMPLEEFDKGFDLAILELAHFSAPGKYYPLLKDRSNIKKICITHYSNRWLPTAFELSKMLPEQEIVLACDGLECNL